MLLCKPLRRLSFTRVSLLNSNDVIQLLTIYYSIYHFLPRVHRPIEATERYCNLLRRAEIVLRRAGLTGTYWTTEEAPPVATALQWSDIFLMFSPGVEYRATRYHSAGVTRRMSCRASRLSTPRLVTPGSVLYQSFRALLGYITAPGLELAQCQRAAKPSHLSTSTFQLPTPNDEAHYQLHHAPNQPHRPPNTILRGACRRRRCCLQRTPYHLFLLFIS